jgi:hypothetical protein
MGIVSGDTFSREVAKAIGISQKLAEQLFVPSDHYARKHYGTRSYRKITPEMVADALERLS